MRGLFSWVKERAEDGDQKIYIKLVPARQLWLSLYYKKPAQSAEGVKSCMDRQGCVNHLLLSS